MIVIGIFDPFRHGIDSDLGYDITRLKRNYRNVSILKHRKGPSNYELGLFFDGGTRTYTELPNPGDKENMDKVYKYIEQINK